MSCRSFPPCRAITCKSNCNSGLRQSEQAAGARAPMEGDQAGARKPWVKILVAYGSEKKTWLEEQALAFWRD